MNINIIMPIVAVGVFIFCLYQWVRIFVVIYRLIISKASKRPYNPSDLGREFFSAFWTMFTTMLVFGSLMLGLEYFDVR